MTRIDTAHHYAQIEQHRDLLEKIRTKFAAEGHRDELVKTVKKSDEARCRSAGKGDHVDVSV